MVLDNSCQFLFHWAWAGERKIWRCLGSQRAFLVAARFRCWMTMTKEYSFESHMHVEFLGFYLYMLYKNLHVDLHSFCLGSPNSCAYSAGWSNDVPKCCIGSSFVGCRYKLLPDWAKSKSNLTDSQRFTQLISILFYVFDVRFSGWQAVWRLATICRDSQSRPVFYRDVNWCNQDFPEDLEYLVCFCFWTNLSHLPIVSQYTGHHFNFHLIRGKSHLPHSVALHWLLHSKFLFIYCI